MATPSASSTRSRRPERSTSRSRKHLESWPGGAASGYGISPQSRRNRARHPARRGRARPAPRREAAGSRACSLRLIEHGRREAVDTAGVADNVAPDDPVVRDGEGHAENGRPSQEINAPITPLTRTGAVRHRVERGPAWPRPAPHARQGAASVEGADDLPGALDPARHNIWCTPDSPPRIVRLCTLPSPIVPVTSGATRHRPSRDALECWLPAGGLFNTTKSRWPRTSRLLRELVESYGRDAKREDIRAGNSRIRRDHGEDKPGSAAKKFRPIALR